jgi:hypothetical protein
MIARKAATAPEPVAIDPIAVQLSAKMFIRVIPSRCSPLAGRHVIGASVRIQARRYHGDSAAPARQPKLAFAL